MKIRLPPNGAFVDVPRVNRVGSSIGNNLSAPIVLTALAAGHEPGMYEVSIDVINRVAPLTGTLARTYSYSAPGVGATTAVGAGTATITQAGHAGATGFNTIGFMSDGSAPILVTLTPAAITGAPVTDLYASAQLVGLPPA